VAGITPHSNMESEIEKLARDFEEALTEFPVRHDIFTGTNLKDEARKLELLAGKLFYISNRNIPVNHRKAVAHAAKLILAASEALEQIT
jgi:hypothetical protein